MTPRSLPFPLTACVLASSMLWLSACGGGDPASPPDTVAPTIAVTDSEAGATAAGPVTFTFTFSKDVGTTFTAEDISVTGGTAGTFTRVSGTQATLLVTPLADATGTLTVSVAALKVSDAAGNGNSVAASGSQAYDTVIAVLASKIVTFDETTAPTLTGFGGAEDASVVSDPANAANKVAKIIKSATAESWAGTTVSVCANQAVATLPFSTANTKMTARVWSPDAGIPVRLKVESATDGTKSVETEATTTVAAGWQTLTFNFASQATGTAALNVATVYNKASVFFNFGKTGVQAGAAKTYYLDDLSFVGASFTAACPAASTTPTPTAALGSITFDESTAPVLTGFGGADEASVVADPTNAANKVAKVVKSATAEVWAGTTVSTLANQAIAAVNFGSSKVVTMRVWSPDVGIPVRLKVESAADGTKSVETEAITTVAGAWQTLSFNFAALAAGSGALDASVTYNKASVFFNFGKSGAQVGAAKTYYFDDVSYAAVAATAAPSGAAVVIASFDSDGAGLVGFEGTTESGVVADPAGGSNKVGKMVKPATNVAPWAGATVATIDVGYFDSVTNKDHLNAVTAIPFTSSRQKLTLRVYSPAVGVRVRLKVETAGLPQYNCETDAFTTKANQWETLTFDFADTSTHYIPSGPTSYDKTKPTVEKLDLTRTFNKVSVFFDYFLGDGASAYARMPGTRTYYFDDLTFAP